MLFFFWWYNDHVDLHSVDRPQRQMCMRGSYMFNQFNMHRVVATYTVTNQRSAALLERLGFEKEGYAKSYLNIAGTWEDHILTALINPKH